MAVVSLPYIVWNIALQSAPNSRSTLLIVGDIMCLLPPVAFQRGLGAIVGISMDYNDPELTWSTTWNWENRLWMTILLMLVVGTVEWVYLYRISRERPPLVSFDDDSEKASLLKGGSTDRFGVEAETQSSLSNETVINVRNIFKLFKSNAPNDAIDDKKTLTNRAVKGVSFGVKKNEIYCVLGPNGAG